jgi:chromosome segregation ATPase
MLNHSATVDHDVLLQKEEELRALYSERVASYEQAVQQRDDELRNLTAHCFRIEEDYKYNLALFEERDHELTELQRELERAQRSIEDLEAKVELAEEAKRTVFELRQSVGEVERRKNEEILMLRNQLEKERVSHEHAMRKKESECLALQSDYNRNLVKQSEETQNVRVSLLQSFDESLHEREQAWRRQEDSIAQQLDESEAKTHSLVMDLESVQQRLRQCQVELAEEQNQRRACEQRTQRLKLSWEARERELCQSIHDLEIHVTEAQSAVIDAEQRVEAARTDRAAHENEILAYQHRIEALVERHEADTAASHAFCCDVEQKYSGLQRDSERGLVQRDETINRRDLELSCAHGFQHLCGTLVDGIVSQMEKTKAALRDSELEAQRNKEKCEALNNAVKEQKLLIRSHEEAVLAARQGTAVLEREKSQLEELNAIQLSEARQREAKARATAHHEILVLKSQHAALEDTIQALEMRLAETLQAGAEQKLAAAQSEIQQLRTRIADLEEQNRNVRHQVFQVTSELEGNTVATSAPARIQQLESELADAHERLHRVRIDTLEEQRAKIVQSLGPKDSDEAIIGGESAKYKRKYDRLRTEYHVLLQQCADYQRRCDDLGFELQRVTTERDNAFDTVNSLVYKQKCIDLLRHPSQSHEQSIAPPRDAAPPPDRRQLQNRQKVKSNSFTRVKGGVTVRNYAFPE